ncbi:hypothetical protein LIPSTDRAFT_26806 [Lipomyces starkeyi NRRL Y-11557]|uniref:Zinc finger PHD-type domain-containing protein n=1 Tax=Lipomyces starkeyi NRRL Y-11557 TaxID=675824 RepID=A0A1E3QAN4_LIPST|nr:hypothetical protein LIPSTDRAFT_26806 [Lipomyces starkeyi NRRL Y-11557]
MANTNTSSPVSATATGQHLGPVEAALAAMTSADAVTDPEVQTQLKQIRNMWQFSAVFQWLFMFKPSIKMEDEDVTIEALEKEFLGLTPLSLIPKIRLRLLQNLSSQRNLTLEQFDEYARRQYRQKAPTLACPFGDDEDPLAFDKMNVFDQIKILHQLCEWQIYNPDRFRERMGTTKESEEIPWRVDPVGWDSQDNTYYLLDDNRLYSRHDPPPEPAPQPKKAAAKGRRKKRQFASYSTPRRSKRRRTNEVDTADEDDEDGTGDDSRIVDDENTQPAQEVDGKPENGDIDYSELLELSRDAESTWRCVCATYQQWQSFFTLLGKSARDKSKAPEREFYAFLKAEIMPVIESLEQDRITDEETKLKEIERLRVYENRKRSSRVDALAQRRKEEEEMREAREEAEHERERKKAENRRRAMLEKEREARLDARDHKLVEAAKKKEAALVKKAAQQAAKLATGMPVKAMSSSPARSERQESQESDFVRRSTRQSERMHLQGTVTPSSVNSYDPRLNPSTWYFDCVCGAFGDNYDDGELSVCCGKCDIWMHVDHLVGEEVRRFEESTRSQQLKEESEERRRVKEAEATNLDVKREDTVDAEELIEEAEFVCNRCVRIERERERERELERKREADRARRRERERKRDAEKRRLKQEAKARELAEQRLAEKANGTIKVTAKPPKANGMANGAKSPKITLTLPPAPAETHSHPAYLQRPLPPVVLPPIHSPEFAPSGVLPLTQLAPPSQPTTILPIPPVIHTLAIPPITAPHVNEILIPPTQYHSSRPIPQQLNPIHLPSPAKPPPRQSPIAPPSSQQQQEQPQHPQQHQQRQAEDNQTGLDVLADALSSIVN